MRKFGQLALALAVCTGALACKSNPEQHLEVTITWSDVKQTVDGFGASSAFFGGNITDAQADALFDAKKGIGLSLLRTMIGVPDDTQDDGSEPTDGANPVATAPELNTAQQAVSRGTKVWATAWTPPPIWKTTNNKKGSGDGYTSNKLDSSHYQDYADYLADFVELMNKASVPLVGVSPANEPDYTATWDDSQWTPEEMTKFIAENLGPTLKERFPSVKIIAPDTASWPACDKYVTSMLADANAKDFVSVIATHPYKNGNDPIVLDYNKPQQNGKSFWETEWSQENMDGDTPDPSMTSAIDMVKHIHDHMVISNMNAWNWWAIYITKDGLNDNLRLNPAFIQPDASMGDPFMFKRGYAFGNWSKFVRPGFQRIGATDKPTKNVLVEAYRDSNHIAVIAINTGASTVTQTFNLEGGTFGTLTPWVTSPDDDLAAKSTIEASDSFTFDLPGQSVVTFVNWDATSETPGQGTLPTVKQDAGVDSKSSNGGLDCSAAVVPNNLVSGGVTDFTDWKGSSGKWGDSEGLWGNVYSYQGPNGSTMNANVDTSAKNLHITGGVTAGDYGGAGLSFSVCATVASFSKVQFTVAGSSPGCDMELQIKTFDQQPTTQTPAGGCDPEGTEGCYNFPVVKQVAVPSEEATTVVTSLADFSKWSEDNAAQVVGLQWQFTGANVDPDNTDGCPIDVTITDIKFLE
jgi:glucuronoarabinoxylan endo-1,4-beta-xylanase